MVVDRPTAPNIRQTDGPDTAGERCRASVGAASRPACDPSPYRLDSQEPASLDPEDGSDGPDGSDGSDDSDGPDGADEPLDGADEPPEGADGAPEGGADGAPFGGDPDGGRGPNPRPGP